ncbi:glycosyltransferase [Algibacter lectus]|uniref:glycosyltransferase family 2 protein n=1 Tax=Algibacter lectus TaxID=221126 RepID=UPI0008F12607|nr:glycosyltransferase family 2 protein [Algibacter lectus]SFD29793.1 glycosyltransferase [Algibacter lectus]
MKVSIITATYNSEATIASCMRSVMEQTYASIEYVIIDGNSSDGTLDVVKQLQAEFPNIEVSILSEPDKGIYDALNKGVKRATGDVIGFVHSDDMLAQTTTIEHLVNIFKTEKTDGVYGDLQYVNKIDPTKVIRHWESCAFDKKLLKKGWMPAHPTLFLTREVYNKHVGFNLTYKIAADYDFILRVFKDDTLRFAYLPEVITKMRAGGASNRSLKNIIIKSKEDYKAITSNNIGSFGTIIQKNVSKLNQFYKKG